MEGTRHEQQPMSETFAAFTAEKTDDGFHRGVTELILATSPTARWSSTSSGRASTTRTRWPSTEQGRVARISPLVPGIDLAGTVRSSTSTRRRSRRCGDRARLRPRRRPPRRLRAGWRGSPPAGSCRFPTGSAPREAMLVGTAGYTAALSVLALLDHGLTPDAGTVVVTGATGGVGSMAVAMLAGLGFTVAASTGKPEAEPFLRGLGASDDRRPGRAQRGRQAAAEAGAGPVRSTRSAARRSRTCSRDARARRRGGGERQRRRRATCRPRSCRSSCVASPSRHRLGEHADRPTPRGVGPHRHRSEARRTRGDGAGRRPGARRGRARRDRSWRCYRPLRRAAARLSAAFPIRRERLQPHPGPHLGAAQRRHRLRGLTARREPVEQVRAARRSSTTPRACRRAVAPVGLVTPVIFRTNW